MRTTFKIKPESNGGTITFVSSIPFNDREWLAVYVSYVLAGGITPEPGRELVVYLEDFTV